MSLVITGDTHGDLRRLTSPKMKEITATGYPDFVGIMGDVGIVWEGNPNNPTEDYWIKWLNEKPWITFGVKGNHENHERINLLPLVDFCGGKAYQVSEKVFFLQTGEHYVIDGKKVFAFGGAMSIDKAYRKNRISWWEEEIPSTGEFYRAMEAIEKLSTVDYVFSHTAPTEIVRMMRSKGYLPDIQDPQMKDKMDDPTCKMLDEVQSRLTFRHWYFGHFHIDVQMNAKFTATYEKVREI